MHASLSRVALVAAIVGPLSLQGWAQQAETGDKKDTKNAGIYVKTGGSDGLIKLRSEPGTEQKTKGIGKTILTQGIVQPTHEAHLNGVKADARVNGGALEFYLVLAAPKSSPDPSADPMAALAAMVGGASDTMPSQAKSGNDFVLIRLKVGETDRVADLGKVNSKLPKDPIPCTVDHLPDGSYRFTPKSSLTAGEYAFVFVGSAMPGSQYWDFGVDAAK